MLEVFGASNLGAAQRSGIEASNLGTAVLVRIEVSNLGTTVFVRDATSNLGTVMLEGFAASNLGPAVWGIDRRDVLELSGKYVAAFVWSSNRGTDRPASRLGASNLGAAPLPNNSNLSCLGRRICTQRCQRLSPENKVD